MERRRLTVVPAPLPSCLTIWQPRQYARPWCVIVAGRGSYIADGGRAATLGKSVMYNGKCTFLLLRYLVVWHELDAGFKRTRFSVDKTPQRTSDANKIATYSVAGVSSSLQKICICIIIVRMCAIIRCGCLVLPTFGAHHKHRARQTSCWSHFILP